MPRTFDSDQSPENLIFVENVECLFCGEVFEGNFFDYTKSLSVQDMTEAPLGDHECPSCGRHFTTTMSGWMFYSEAG